MQESSGCLKMLKMPGGDQWRIAEQGMGEQGRAERLLGGTEKSCEVRVLSRPVVADVVLLYV